MKTKRVLGVLAGSLFAILIMFIVGACPTGNETTPTPPPVTVTVTSVTVDPLSIELQWGQTQQFTASVLGTNSPAQTVIWTITGNSGGTTLSDAGLLTLGNETEGAVLTIKAISTVDPTVSGTATVTAHEPSAVPVVYSVVVGPEGGTVGTGATFQFRATVSVGGPADSLPATTVTWSIEEAGKAAGTTISADGLLTVASDEPLTTLTIRATSTELDNKFGTVTISVFTLTGFAGTQWTDGQIPESTIKFTTASTVTLDGRYWSQHNGGTGTPIAGVRTYETSANLRGPAVEPAVWVVLDSTNRIGFELYYYYPMANGQPGRLVAYVNGLQPRVFYKPGEGHPPVTGGGGGEITDIANPAKNALVTYFNSTALDVAIGNTGAATAARLIVTPAAGNPPAMTPNTTLHPGVGITGELTYTTEAAGGPAITYTIGTTNPVTYDVYAFSQAEGEELAAALGAHLGVLSGNHADITAGYKYFGANLTAALTAFPNAGKVAITIPLVKDPFADIAVGEINAAGAITGVAITGSGATIAGGVSYAASYTSATHTLQVTVPASGISASGATAVARALSTAVTGKITTDDAGYTVPLSASAAVSGANVTASIVLSQVAIAAAPITTAVNAVTTPAGRALNIAAANVTSGVITALNGIANATGTATAAYDSTRHEVAITVTPAANLVFNTTANTYNAVATAINTRFAGFVTNSVDTSYNTVNATTYTITGGNLVFTVSFSNYIDGATITAALAGVANASGATIASATSVTGAVLTALGGIANATSTVTTTYSSANHTFAIRVAPAAGFTFNPGLVQSGANVVSPYAAVGTTIVAKLGATVTNSEDSAYSGVKSSVGIEVVSGNLVFTVQTAVAVPASDLITAINGAADGNITLTAAFNWATFGTDWSVSGALVSAFAPPLVETVTGGYVEASGNITITLTPGAEYVFGPATDYPSVATALFAKPIQTITSDNKGNITLRTATGVTHAVTGGNLVLTIATAPAP